MMSKRRWVIAAVVVFAVATVVAAVVAAGRKGKEGKRVGPPQEAEARQADEKGPGGQALEVDDEGEVSQRTPDGHELVFVSGGQVWRSKADGSGRTKIAKLPEGVEAASFSRDARYLLCRTRREYEDHEGPKFDQALLAVDLGSGRTRKVGEKLRCGVEEEGYFEGPEFSPDGRYVVYQDWLGHESGSTFDIEVVSSQGGEATLLRDRDWLPPVGSRCGHGSLDRDIGCGSPHWSPNGDRIAGHYIMWLHYPSDEGDMMCDPNPSRGIAVVRVASNKWTYFPGFDECQFSPDGTKLELAKNRDDGRTDLWIANVDGSGLREVARNAEGLGRSPESRDWSPTRAAATPSTPRPRSAEKQPGRPARQWPLEGTERKAALDAVRKAWGKTEQFHVIHAVIKDGWAYVIVEPYEGPDDKWCDERGHFLLVKRDSQWRVLEGPRPWLKHWQQEWAERPDFDLEAKLRDKYLQAMAEIFK